MKSLAFFIASASVAYASDSTNSSSSSSSSSTTGLLLSGNVALGDWAAAYEKAQKLVLGLTFGQKLSIITGASANGSWDALHYKDGASGVETDFMVSGFSGSNALAFSFDRDLVYEQSQAVAREFFLRGYQVIDGPTSGPLGRNPWDGRISETLGQDSYLNGIVVGLQTKAVVSQKVIPGGKHFLLYEQETNRMSSSDPYSANADDKTIHETYLQPFYEAVKNGMGAAMCAMNRINGTQTCESSDLLMTLLKTHLGFPGHVWPDVSAQHTALGSASGGMDYGSSQYWSESFWTASIANGSLTEARLDDMVMRDVIPYYFVGLDTADQPTLAGTTDFRDVRANHSDIIRRTGAAAMVLLKNNGALPLDRPKFVTLFGAHAGPAMAGPNQELTVQGSGPTYQGHLATSTGGGSGSLTYLVTPFQSITDRAIKDGSMIAWVMNDTYTASTSSGSGGAGGMPTMGDNSTTGGMAGSSGASNSSTGDTTTGSDGMGGGIGNIGSGTGIAPSITGYAAQSDACLVFLNALSGEGKDRTELYSVDQDTLVTTVASECNNTIVVINTVGARLVDAWIDHSNVTAVLYGPLLGQESGNSIADVLYGAVNPSAKLPYTIAKNESDYDVQTSATDLEIDFSEGNYIDYKSFEARNVIPRYAFGYGLSYTSFEFSGLGVAAGNISAGAASTKLAVGGPEDFYDTLTTVSVTVENMGAVAGAEIAQLYIGFPDAAAQPAKQLRGFEKVSLEAGGCETVSFELRRKDLSYWDVTAQNWVVAAGEYKVMVGASSADIKLNSSFTV